MIPSWDPSSECWGSRSRAFAWATAYSIQFEFGPLSEALHRTWGCGRKQRAGLITVVTPAGALGFMVMEDALDRHLMTRIESWTDNRFVLILPRVMLNPSRNLSNTGQRRMPWARDGRPLP